MSSVIAASFVAAQNVSSGRMWRNAALVMCGHHVFGIPLRVIARQAADRRRLEIILRPPHRHLEPERQHALADLAGFFDERLVAFPAFARADRGAAERRAEIEQVIADEAAAVLGDQRRQRVDALGVDVIEPRGEHEIAAQLAAMFVRDRRRWDRRRGCRGSGCGRPGGPASPC